MNIDKDLSWDITRQYADDVFYSDIKSRGVNTNRHKFSFNINESISSNFDQKTPESLPYFQKKTKHIARQNIAHIS